MALWIRFTGDNAWAKEHRGGDDGKGSVRFDSPCPTVNAFPGGLGGAIRWTIEDDGRPDEGDVTRRILVRASGQVGKRSADQSHPFDEPSPTIQKMGLGDQRPTDIRVVDDGRPEAPLEPDDRPPYRVPLVSEIRAVPRNGLTAMSTFSGCGGSCLGFEWAGYRPLLAVEFVPAAADSYEANRADVPVYRDDIRGLTARKALALMGLRKGELDVLEGSPPCESFSTAGQLSKGWGQERSYSDGMTQRMDDLFYEFVRLLGGIKPRAFMAENVAGLVRGVSKGHFLNIHAALEAQGYRVQARMLDAQWLGVPQRRRRVIFVGVRNDLKIDPPFPDPLPYRYSIRDALVDVEAGADGPVQSVTHDTSGLHSTGALDLEGPMMTVTKAGGAASWHFRVDRDETEATPEATAASSRKFTIAELRRLCGFPDDFVLTGSYAQQWERLGNSVPPPMAFHIAAAIRDALLAAPRPRARGGASPRTGRARPPRSASGSAR